MFLGHSERGPSIQIRPSWSPVFCDLGGQKVPIDMMYDGEEAMVTADLTRWNEGVYAVIADKGNPVAGFANRGTTPGGGVGTLALTEGMCYPLWVQFPYAAKAAYATMPPAYHFVASFLETDDQPELGTKARKIHLVWHCLRAYNPATNTFTLFDSSTAGLGVFN